MGKKLHLDPLAEREATDVGAQFMQSRDVVGDMSRAYGRDLSSVRIHTDESAARRAEERGVDAFSTGKDVFFARGAFNQNDPASRGLLAHELSHSMQQGVGGGVPAMAQSAPMGAEQGGIIDWFRNLFRRRNPENNVRFTEAGNSPTAAGIGRFFRDNNNSATTDRFIDPRRAGLFNQVREQMSDVGVYGDGLTNAFQNASGSVHISGFNPSRTLSSLMGPLGGDMTTDQIAGIYDKLLSGGRYAELRRIKANNNITPERQAEMDRYTPEQVAGMDARFDEGMHELKGVQLAQLRRLKDKYGIYGSQMHPEDFITRVGPELFADVNMLQDSVQMLKDGGRYFDFENNAEDREYKLLSDYYNDVFNTVQLYASTDHNVTEGDFDPGSFEMDFFKSANEPKQAVAAEESLRALGARGFTSRQQRSYEKRVRKRFGTESLRSRLFGRFLR